MSHRNTCLAVAVGIVFGGACLGLDKPKSVPQNPAVKTQRVPKDSFDDKIEDYHAKLFKDGRKIFRSETFGSEAFFGGTLQLHKAILGQANGGVGPGLSPLAALEAGIKVDVGQVPKAIVEVIKGGDVSLKNPDTTIELLKADAVIGVKGFFRDGKLVSVGIQCALCHSTVDDSFMRGIGRRLDGWPNRDLNVGAIVAMSPGLGDYAKKLGKSEDDVRKVLLAWGPGRYDAEFNQDGIGFRPDGKTAATVLPAAFGLAGVNLHTYTGWGSVTYWNAYVANTQMMGQGVFYDPRLHAKEFPAAGMLGNEIIRPQDLSTPSERQTPDRVTSKLAALHYYQLSIPAPTPPKGSYDARAAARGKLVFEGKAQCARCHVPPLFTEPGYGMHKPDEIGIDAFQANRSPDKMYRTTPLRGLFVRAKGGFYHDGRFADLSAVVQHYEQTFNFDLDPRERNDLIQYLKSL
jgi:mono/diheme cytochrome c family protein